MSTINKSFIIDFDETAIDKHAVPASSVAQSLLSLLALLQSISKQLFGKQSVAEVKLKAARTPAPSWLIFPLRTRTKILFVLTNSFSESLPNRKTNILRKSGSRLKPTMQ